MPTSRKSPAWQNLPVIALLLLIQQTSWLPAAEFPAPYNSQDDAQAVATPPQVALESLQLPPGFKASLFAAEPDIQNPIALTWDARGRLWVAENFTYAEGKTRFEMNLRDRILIFDDENRDGQFDTRRVFSDDLQILTSIEVGHGGIWALCPPQLLFIPDANHDDIPDGPPQVVLDGFTVSESNFHNFANGLRWGPDGWLYGRCGHACPGEIGVPGTSSEQRHTLHGGMWRYHPGRKQVEVITTGTTNPWGHDWNALGECFFVNTVNGHFWYGIRGAHFNQGNSGRDPNPHTYQLIDQHADHWHFDTGLHWSKSRDGAANELGGGHAHSGAMIYLGDQFPQEYHGHLFTVNLHGLRINNEIIERSGSGFVAHHGQDLLITKDPWFRGIDLTYGPDGGVFLLDWSDTGECHERNGVHRTSGRIFKITAGNPADPGTFDLRQLPDSDLIDLHRSQNEWYVRQARLLLSERQSVGQLQPRTIANLLAFFQGDHPVALQVRAMLTLFSINALDEEFLIQQLQNPRESVRVWAIRMLTDHWPQDDALGPVKQDEASTLRVKAAADRVLPALCALAKLEPSGLVRLTLASALQKLPVTHRAALAQVLVSREEDAHDHNLPLMVWYGLIPVADYDPELILPVAAACTWPQTRNCIARRLAEEIEQNPAPISHLLTYTATQPQTYALDILNGIAEALRGWRKATPPASWGLVQVSLENTTSQELAQRVRELNVLFGDGRALDEMITLSLDTKVPVEARQAALTQIIESRPPNLRKLCEQLLKDRNLAVVAASGLAQYDDPEIARELIQVYRNFQPEARPQIVSILVSRPAFARLLLQAMAAGKIPRKDLTSYHVRQLHSLGDQEIKNMVTEVWGQLRDSPEEKRLQMAQLKARLTPDVLQHADLSQGRLQYNALCGKCHRLYGEGQLIGPDLTGSNRSNLDYLLENIIDPSAVVNKDFRMSVLALADGRILNGVIVAQTDRTLTLQSLTEKVTLDKKEIEEIQATLQSPMPEGQFDKLTPEQIRDLIAYLMHPGQVPLPAGADAH